MMSWTTLFAWAACSSAGAVLGSVAGVLIVKALAPLFGMKKASNVHCVRVPGSLELFKIAGGLIGATAGCIYAVQTFEKYYVH